MMFAHKKISTKSPRARRISLLWCLARDLGLDSTNLHTIVESATGHESIAALNNTELSTVIQLLKIEINRRRNHASYERRKNIKSGVVYLQTQSQRDMVRDLLNWLNVIIPLNNPSAYLGTICRKTFKKEYLKLNMQETKSLIETLKAIIKRYTKEA